MSESGRANRSDPKGEWEAVRAFLRAHPERLSKDAALLAELGLRPSAANIVEFGPAALARHVAARVRESNARQQLETTARANYAAQAQAHGAVLDLLGARNNADLARLLDEAAVRRFGLVGGAIALEETAPAGWRRLNPGGVDKIMGPEGEAWMGQPLFPAELFLERAGEVRSNALIRVRVGEPGRAGLIAFASADPDGFSPDMGIELIALLARVTERVAERWPIL